MSLHFEGISQYDMLNARDRLHQIRVVTRESIQTVEATLPLNTLCIGLPQAEPDCKNLQIRLPKYKDSLGCQDCNRIHRPLSQAHKGWYYKLKVFP